MENFPQRLKELRKLYKITQKQISDITNITSRVYQSYEYGKVVPTATALISLADFFYVSIDYLVGRNDDPNYEYYFDKTVSALSQNMPKPFIDLLNYSIVGGFSKNKPLLKDKFDLLHSFKMWKEIICQFNKLLKIKSTYRQKEQEAYDEKIFKNKPLTECPRPKAHGLVDLIKEKIIYNIKDPYSIINYDSYISLSEPYLEYNLEILIKYETFYHDSITASEWIMPPIPKEIGAYLYPLTKYDRDHNLTDFINTKII